MTVSHISPIKYYLLTSETLERHSCLEKKIPSSPCFSSTQSLASSVAIFCNTLSEDTDQTTRWLITSVVTKRWPCHFLCTSKDSQLKEALVINCWQALSCWFLSTCFLLYLSKYWASRQLLFSLFPPSFFFQNERTHSNHSLTWHWNSNIAWL